MFFFQVLHNLHFMIDFFSSAPKLVALYNIFEYYGHPAFKQNCERWYKTVSNISVNEIN